MRQLLLALTVFFVLTSRAPAADEKDPVPLFDGKTLDGWKKAGGGATYKVDDGCILGEVGPGANTFLCTEKQYANFILHLDVKLEVPGNSGIQLRSHVTDRGRVFGYQCEIDPSARAWSAGIYDEGRRGWLYPLDRDEKARKAFRIDGWNHFVIHAEGPRIRTWLNDIPCADLLDAQDADGFIALQVHSGTRGRIRWKNIRIRELPPSKWEKLLADQATPGWKKIGGGDWKIQDGVLHGTSARTEPRHGLLLTEKAYGDFAIKLRFRAIKGNSGLYFRVEETPDQAVMVRGFQAEIDPANDVGGLYETLGRGWVVKPKPEDVKKWIRPGQWNDMTVIALGGRVAVTINGHRSAALSSDPGRKRGPIGLQLHGGQDMDVQFREIEILELPEK